MSKHLDRRTLLKLAGLAAGASLVPASVHRALADTAPYTGLFLVTIHASGGWDPLLLCDPKSNRARNRVSTGMGTAGNLRFAEHDIDPVALGFDASYATEYRANMMTNRAFFERHHARTIVFNGVDTHTNNHDTGTRYTWSGHSPIGHPSIGALAASAGGAGRPLAFLSQGGYDFTAGVVPLARAGNADALARIATPNEIDPNNAETDLYHSSVTYNRILEAQRARLTEQRAAARLPRLQGALSRFEQARLGTADLERLVLPESLVSIPGYNLYDLQLMMQQTQIAMSAFTAGVSICASLELGGFDTHSDHDRGHVRQLAKLLRGIDYVREQAVAAGLGSRVVILVGSDFGRGPDYNGPNEYDGKDHWPTTSMMALLPDGMSGGDRIIGASDDDQLPATLDPASLAVRAGGVRLTPANIHRSLRRMLSLDATDAARHFPLLGEDLPIFG